MAIGIRADEPRRVAKMRANNNPESVKISNIVPLADANVGVQDVIAFWDAAPFDLALPTYKGRTLAGNCDLCFLKPAGQVLSLIQQRPSRAVWWAKQEAYAAANFKSNRLHGPGTGWFFSMDRPSYAAMASNVVDQATLFDPSEEGAACFCGEYRDLRHPTPPPPALHPRPRPGPARHRPGAGSARCGGAGAEVG